MNFRPFPFVIVTAIALLGVKMMTLIVSDKWELAQIDMLQTGSISKRQQSPLSNDDIFIRALTSLPPKDAARVFSGLELHTQAEIAPRLSPTLFGDILAEMPAEKAEKLAVLLANRK